MPHDISFLHTDRVHIPTFASLMEEYAPHLSVRHVVKAELLEQARNEAPDKELNAHIQNAMQAAASTGARVVVCTCSTIGAAAELTENDQTFTAMRIDRPMTVDALTTGRRILVAATLESTLAPTKELICDSAEKLALSDDTYHLQSLLIEHAWPFFEGGDSAQYFQAIQRSLSADWRDFDVIVLAQASMSGVQALCKDIKIPLLSSPVSGIQAAIKLFDKSTKR